MTKSKREELGQIVIRPPEGMRERIKEIAERNKRSMNAEIIRALEKWIEEEEYAQYQLEYYRQNPPEGPKEGDTIEEGWIPDDNQSQFGFIQSKEDVEEAVERMTKIAAENMRREMLKWFKGK